MGPGLKATIGVFALVGFFGLIVLRDRKKIKQQEQAPSVQAEAAPRMSPEERWQRHVDRLKTTGS